MPTIGTATGSKPAPPVGTIPTETKPRLGGVFFIRHICESMRCRNVAATLEDKTMAKAWRKKGKRVRQERALARLLAKPTHTGRDVVDIANLKKCLGVS